MTTIARDSLLTLEAYSKIRKSSRAAAIAHRKLRSVVLGEHVTLDRTNGEFKQWIDLDGEKRLNLITGRCKRTTNAPF